MAPPQKDVARHEDFLNNRRSGDRGDRHDACPLSPALPDFVKHLQKQDRSRWRTRCNERWDQYCRTGRGNDYRGGCPNKDPTKKELTFLRDFVCSLWLTDYFCEFDEYWRSRQGGYDSAPSTEAASQGRDRSWGGS